MKIENLKDLFVRTLKDIYFRRAANREIVAEDDQDRAFEGTREGARVASGRDWAGGNAPVKVVSGSACRPRLAPS
jgi:hypothetical protein